MPKFGCLICDRRFDRQPGDPPYCGQHRREIARMAKDEQRNGRPEPDWFIAYKGDILGAFPKNGGYQFSYLGQKGSPVDALGRPRNPWPSWVKRNKLINLDSFVRGMSRGQIGKIRDAAKKALAV